MSVQFFREKPTDIFHEILPLLTDHYLETYGPIRAETAMNPDFETYSRLERAKAYKLFTARNGYGELIGYAGYYFRQHPHADMILAAQDLIYIKPQHRGLGKEFIPFIEQSLRSDGAHVITQAVRPTRDFSSMLVRNGYQLEETIYSKKL